MKSCLFVVIVMLVVSAFLGTVGFLYIASKDAKPQVEESAAETED